MSDAAREAAIVAAAKSCKCLIFDWDGTLVDSLAKIIAAVHYTADKLGLPKVESSVIRQGIGLGAAEQVMSLYGDAVDVAKFREVFEQRYYSRESERAIVDVFPGVEKMLYALYAKGYMLTIATGKSSRGLQDELAYLGWQDLFSVTCCAEDYFSKPHPAMVEHIISQLGLAVDQAIVIGDSHVDLQMANAAGVGGVGVLTGVDNHSTLLANNPLTILEEVTLLAKILH